MEETKEKPKLNLSAVMVAVALGIIVAVVLYQAQIKGWIPGNNLSRPTQTQETRTIVQEENAIISVVDKVSPSVVAIGVSKKVINPLNPFNIPQTQDNTIGTGFVVSERGIIVTNKHVVADTDRRYMIITNDDQKYDVRRIYRDPILDLAVIEVDASGLKPLQMGDSSKLQVGQTVIAIGNALGRFTNTVTTGIVSGLGRRVVAGDPFSGSVESLDNLIQTDAAINPGNSGGPLLNSAGQVIGVNVATTEGAQNIGFAIPINAVKSIIDEFVTKGTVSRPYLGIRYVFVARDLAILNEIPQGAYIQEVLTNGPAHNAGVKYGDIITKINGQTIDSEGKVSEIVAGSKIGDRLELEVWRDGKILTPSVVLEDLPTE